MSRARPRLDRGHAPRPSDAPARLLEPLIQAAPGASAVAVAAFHGDQHLLATAGTTRRHPRGGPIRPYRTTGGVGAVVRERRAGAPETATPHGPAEPDGLGDPDANDPPRAQATPHSEGTGSAGGPPAAQGPGSPPGAGGTEGTGGTATAARAGGDPDGGHPTSPEATGGGGPGEHGAPGVVGAGGGGHPDGAPQTDCVAACGSGSEPEPRHPIDPHTPFEIGSVTKTFTALLLAELVARGEVRYDDPVTHYLPARLAPPAHGAPITLLHLATHTAGLPRLPPGLLRRAAPYWFSNPYAAFAPDDLLAALPRTRPFAAPGTRMRYSNYGVGLLGVLLARAAGTDYPTLLRERVLDPLGLHDTGCRDTGDRVTGYWHRRPRPHWRIPALPAAGALRSSAHDLLRYLTALLGPSEWPGAGPLRTALGDVLRPRLALPGGGERICLLWNARHRTDHDLYFHSGGTRGCTAFVGFSPQRRVALVALANTSPTLHGAFIQRAYLTLRELASTGAGRLPSGAREPTVTTEV